MREVWDQHGAYLRQVAAKTAKKTSARPEVLARRTEVLRRWRAAHPEEVARITELMMAGARRGRTRVSRFEERMAQICPYAERNVMFRTQSGQRIQIDFVWLKVWLEVDGPHHFQPVYGEARFQQTLARDQLVCREAERRGLAFIRIALDCFTRKGDLRSAYWRKICKEVSQPTPGLMLIGALYRFVPWGQGAWSISKWRPPTSSPLGMGS